MNTITPDKNAQTAPKKMKKQALGKGLGALIPDLGTQSGPVSGFLECPIDRIRPNRYQPRRRFEAAELEELSQSIRAQGVLQPLLVRKDGDAYELVAGERRLRAARNAGLEKVPVVVKQISDTELLEMSIIENIQREDLNPLEEADAYHQLMTRFGMTQDQVAERIGKSRPTVANFVRLRQLPAPIKSDILAGTLSSGHARALLAARTPAIQEKVWRSVASKRLSVRQTEALVKQLNQAKETPAPRKKSSDEIYFNGIAEDLSRHFGTRVKIHRKGKKGRLEVEFYNDDDLDRILTLLKGR